jgi:membrane protease YdiL (CAAX protease family)
VTSGLVWPPEDWPTLVVLLTAAVVFVVYHYGFAAARRGEARAVHRQRLGGAVLLGVVPALVAAAVLPRGLAHYGLGKASAVASVVFVAGAALVVLPVIWVASRRPDFRTHYPEIRAGAWDRRLRLENAATWGVYLLAYEFFFRGFLLFALRDAFGAWPAVGVTTLAYVYAHLPKNAAETAGTIPMGVVFAAAALATGAIWAPFALHLLIATWSDALAARAA